MSTIFTDWNPRAAQFMESLTAIAAGLGLRYVVGVVSHNDLKITSTLIGLWEGVVLLHFQQKMRHSWDPYVAYAVRLFIDFLATESVPRLVLVVLWSGVGMILADIAPAIWEDTGMRRIWSRFRRDLHFISRSFALPKPRTVRFSPSRATSVATSIPSSSVRSTPTPSVISALPAVPPTPRRKSRWPGALDSETETVLSTDQESQGDDYTLSGAPPSDLPIDDDDDIYASSSSSTTTERPDLDIPEIHVEPEVELEPLVTTPKVLTIVLPPTPSDSVLLGDELVDEHPVIPLSADVPTIPDLPETADVLGNEDWENVEIEEIPTDEIPTPPPKDDDPINNLEQDEEAKPVPPSVDTQNDIGQEPAPQGSVDVPAETAAKQLAESTKQLSPPPSFSAIYPDEPLDTPQEESQPAQDAAVDPPPSPTASNRSSKMLNLTEALDLRQQIAVLSKQRDELMKEHQDAEQDDADGVTAFHNKEAENLDKKIQKLKKQADRRSFLENDEDLPDNKLDVSNVKDVDKAVELVEERLYLLLAPESDATSLEVTVAKAVKGRPLKAKAAILTAMKDNGMDVREDPKNGRLITITLPINS